MKNVTNPTRNNSITLSVNGSEIEREEEVANTFNEHFREKINKLRECLDMSETENPTSRLKEKIHGNQKKHFELRPVSEKEVFKAITSLKPKKSAGLDGVSQELVRSMASVIKLPLKHQSSRGLF